MKNTKALVVLSGGQDSTTCLFWAKHHFSEIHAITYSYGQRHWRELESAKKVAEMAGVASHEFLNIEDAIKDFSPMTNTDVELKQYDSIESLPGEGVQTTFVPGRNIIFLTIGANRAWQLGARNLITGVCQEESGGYPDTTITFVQSMQTALTAGMGEGFEIHAPLMYMSKAESVHLAKELPGCWEALAYTHTAYDGQYPPTGHDHATVLRAKGFLEAGLPDPLILRANKEGLIDLPKTTNYDLYRG